MLDIYKMANWNIFVYMSILQVLDEDHIEQLLTSPYPQAKCNAVLPSESSSSLSAPAVSAAFKP